MTRPALFKNSAGFTLAEVMVAILIMMVGMVGLLQAIGVAFEQNLRNQQREQAVYLGEKYMNDLRGKSFDSYSVSPAHYTPLSVASTFRGGGGRYTVERNVTDISTDGLTKQLDVTVKWTFKTVQYQNRVVAPISQAPN